MVWPIFVSTESLKICIQTSSVYECTIQKKKLAFCKFAMQMWRSFWMGFFSIVHIIFSFPWIKFHRLSLWGRSLRKKEQNKKFLASYCRISFRKQNVKTKDIERIIWGKSGNVGVLQIKSWILLQSKKKVRLWF